MPLRTDTVPSGRIPSSTAGRWVFPARRQGTVRKHIRRPAFALLLILCIGCSFPVHAADGLWLVLSRSGGAYAEFASAFRDEATHHAHNVPDIRVVPLDDLSVELSAASATGGPGVIVSVGTSAARAIAKLRPERPVLYALVPRSTYATLMSQYPGPSDNSALYIDQPYERQLELAKLAVPNAKRVGVLLGPTSRASRTALTRAALRSGLRLVVHEITDPSQLIDQLSNLLERSDVFLAIPDPLVSNQRTAPNILLTTYRYRRPVIAYSRAYVRAGALCAVYSTPRQLGAQAYGLAAKMLADNPGNHVAPQYPRQFDIRFNEYVARSLTLPIPDIEALKRRLLNREGVKR